MTELKTSHNAPINDKILNSSCLCKTQSQMLSYGTFQVHYLKPKQIRKCHLYEAILPIDGGC